MFTDNKLTFNTDWSTPQDLTGTADSTGLIDVAGVGSGTAPTMINGFPNVKTAIGDDYGAGDGVARPYLYLTITTTGTSSNTLMVQLEAAPDGGSYTPGSYTTLWTSPAWTCTTLIKGNYLIVPVPPTLFQFTSSKEALPRFYKLVYTMSSTPATVSVLAGFVLNPPSALLGGQYNNNLLAV